MGKGFTYFWIAVKHNPLIKLWDKRTSSKVISCLCGFLSNFSPMILMITYKEGINECGEWTARCSVTAGELFPDAYTITIIILLFLVPFFILLVTYGMIARKLTSDRTALNAKNENHKARKQVVLMLGTVVFTFFLCLLPFRVLTLFVVLVESTFFSDYAEAYQNFVYFSRIMIYINSALNPILYNIMSSKFRNGFLRLCNRNRKHTFKRTGTFITNTTTNSTNASINLGHQPGANGNPFGKGNGHCSGHNPLGHTSSLHNKRNGSPSSRPDLLKTLIRTQSTASTTAPASATIRTANNAASICNSQCIHYYNSHASGNSIRHHHYSGVNGVAVNNANGCCIGGGGGGRGASKKVQNHLSYGGHHPNGTTDISGKVSNNLSPQSNGDCCMNGKHMTVKSDTIYSAYLQGTRSETVL